MSDKKYVYAVIKIPIEIQGSGGYEPMKQYIDVEFEKCVIDPRSIREPRESPFSRPLQHILKEFISKTEAIDEPKKGDELEKEKGPNEEKPEEKCDEPNMYNEEKPDEEPNMYNEEKPDEEPNTDNEEQPKIYRGEMKSSKKSLNTSFKIKPIFNRRHTAKNRYFIEEEDVDPLEPQEVLEQEPEGGLLSKDYEEDTILEQPVSGNVQDS